MIQHGNMLERDLLSVFSAHISVPPLKPWEDVQGVIFRTERKQVHYGEGGRLGDVMRAWCLRGSSE